MARQKLSHAATERLIELTDKIGWDSAMRAAHLSPKNARDVRQFENLILGKGTVTPQQARRIGRDTLSYERSGRAQFQELMRQGRHSEAGRMLRYADELGWEPDYEDIAEFDDIDT
jgi:hypothetical protein